MKKYISPKAALINLNAESMIATSDPKVIDGEVITDPALSNRRHVSIWDNDEE